MRLAKPLLRALSSVAVLATLTVATVVSTDSGPAAAGTEPELATCPPPEASSASASAGRSPAGMGVVDWRGLVPAGLGSMMR